LVDIESLVQVCNVMHLERRRDLCEHE
jgi:hypothetical protein